MSEALPDDDGKGKKKKKVTFNFSYCALRVAEKNTGQLSTILSASYHFFCLYVPKFLSAYNIFHIFRRIH